MNYQVVIPAAGQGKRMNAGINKIFIKLKSKPIIIHTLSIFESDPSCVGIVLVINKEEQTIFEQLLTEYKITKVRSMIHGGHERQHSIYNGLKSGINADIILVHDGARPFVSREMINRLIEKTRIKDAAILAVPLKDTVKRVATDSIVSETVERSNLWAAQTPQAFRLPLLLEAYENAEKTNYVGTDDASLVERLGKNVYIVEGDYKNIKITTPDDLLFADVILQNWTS